MMKKLFGLMIATSFALSACGDKKVSISEKDLENSQTNANANANANANFQTTTTPKALETTSMDMSENSDIITNAIDISAGSNVPQTVPKTNGPMISSDFNKK